jgi:hypothetical protein
MSLRVKGQLNAASRTVLRVCMCSDLHLPMKGPAVCMLIAVDAFNTQAWTEHIYEK